MHRSSPYPVAESHHWCKVQRRNRGRQIASSSRCRLTPIITKFSDSSDQCALRLFSEKPQNKRAFVLESEWFEVKAEIGTYQIYFGRTFNGADNFKRGCRLCRREIGQRIGSGYRELMPTACNLPLSGIHHWQSRFCLVGERRKGRRGGARCHAARRRGEGFRPCGSSSRVHSRWH